LFPAFLSFNTYHLEYSLFIPPNKKNWIKTVGDTSKFWQGVHQKNRRLGLVVVEQKRT
jgi:hypothetical protein